MQPYKISVYKNNYYGFTTGTGIKYACYFLSYSEYFKRYKEIANSIYAFNVEVIENCSGRVPVDERTGFTIIRIVKIFLEGLENAVVYVCDMSDGREFLRKRKFDLWFRKFDDGVIIKVDGYIDTPGFHIYNTILIHKDNPRKNQFIEAFNDLNEPGDEK